MISHLTLGVRDVAPAAPFYRAVARALDLLEWKTEPDGGPEMLCFHVADRAAPRLYVTTPFDDGPATV